MINSSYYCPNIFPIKGTGDEASIARVQSIDPSVSLNRTKVEEVGNPAVVGYVKKSPTIGYRMTQFEYGDIGFWQKIVCNESVGGSSDVTGIALKDFKSSYFDLAAYLTDDNEIFKGTVYYPSLRTAGFSLSIGDPQAIIERSYDFVGDAAKILQGNNKYLIYQRHTAGSGDDNEITLDNTAVVNPDVALQYQLRVVRITAAGVVTELSKSAGDYTEDATTVTITSITTADNIKLWYTSSTAPTALFTPNTSDKAAIIGDSIDVFLYVPASGKPTSDDYMYRLQSVTLDVSFDRDDQRELGNKNVVQRGVKSSTVSVSIGSILESFAIEEVLRGVAPDFGIIDVERLTDNATLIIKIYNDSDKTDFKCGFVASGLSPMDLGGGVTTNEHVKKDTTLECESLIISANDAVIGI